MRTAAIIARTTMIAIATATATASCASAPGPLAPSPQQRLNPAELEAWGRSAEVHQGTSGVAGIETGILKGTPSRAGLYSILLRVPANTRIEAHDHPDDRVATVLSGTWHFGYGDKFDEGKLKALPPGSFYAEPPNTTHFARTLDTPVVLLIVGFGPTGTRYVDKSADPRADAEPGRSSR